VDRGVRPGSTRPRERLECSRGTAKSQVEKYPVMFGTTCMGPGSWRLGAGKLMTGFS
jgi:hypothetical protein